MKSVYFSTYDDDGGAAKVATEVRQFWHMLESKKL